jgi:hypothetical protein
MTTTQTPKPRYGVRKVGSKHDYIRRFAVIDKTTGRQVPYSTTDDRADAIYQAEELNARHEGREPKSYADHIDDTANA